MLVNHTLRVYVYAYMRIIATKLGKIYRKVKKTTEHFCSVALFIG